MAPPPSAAVAAAPPSTAGVSPVVALVVRILTLIFLLISLIILATDTATTTNTFGAQIKIRSRDIYAYRYMMASTIIGIAYTLLQTAFTIFQVSTGNRIRGEGIYQLDFYGDKAMSYLLATGAAAGFGLTVDANRASNDSNTKDFLNKANAAASILLVGFLFSAASSVFSSFSLPKRGQK